MTQKEFTIDFFKNQEMNKWCVKYSKNLFLGFDTYVKNRYK